MTINLGEISTLQAEAASLLPALRTEHRRHPVHRTSRTETRKPIPRDTRKVVYARDNFRCVWCGKGNPDVRLTLDHHPIPWSAGGSDEPDNLRTLCWDCNEKKSNFQTPDELFRRLPIVYWCDHCDPVGVAVLPLHHPGISAAFCYWCLRAGVGIPSSWFADNNAFWDYDLNWHRDKPAGWTRDDWESRNA